MMRCADCKHWDNLYIVGSGMAECGRHSYKTEDDDKALAAAYESFWTKPDFGCVQFEAKEYAERYRATPE